jgi:diguanylate cyclase (GGDEF)-like protein
MVHEKIHSSSEALKNSLSLLEATLESTADGILVVDREGKIVSTNRKFCKMWEIPEEIMNTKNDHAAIECVLRQLKDPDGFVRGLGELYANPDTDVFDEIEFKDGRIYERYSIPQKSGNKVIGRVFSFRDVTDRKRLEAQLLHQATHDTLTNLPNRALLLDRIKQDIKHAKRNNRLVAIIFLDLDRFKDVNDSMGHDMGDVLLKKLAKRLEKGVREYDTLARWGGDEFVMIIPDLKKEEDVIPIIRNCMQALAATFQVKEKKIKVTNSIGVSFYPKDGELPKTLLKNADSAMYHAKAQGRNNYQFYQRQMSEYVNEKLELENDLNLALENNELFLAYQPIVNLKTGSIKSVEALLRWNHPERGLIGPDKFIPIAEETGLIIPIGRWLLKEGCSQYMAWKKEGLELHSIAINVSPFQLRYPNFTSELDDILRETKMNPDDLEMEITESGLMSDAPIFINLIKQLKRKGISINIDDFGTGYSSLNYLKVFSVDTLKIDKSFVQDEPYTKKSIILSIIALAKKLKLNIIAEGVETHTQCSFLQKHQCDYAQGYYFSRPAEPETISQLLEANAGEGYMSLIA